MDPRALNAECECRASAAPRACGASRSFFTALRSFSSGVSAYRTCAQHWGGLKRLVRGFMGVIRNLRSASSFFTESTPDRTGASVLTLGRSQQRRPWHGMIDVTMLISLYLGVMKYSSFYSLKTLE